jgi:tRNA modification GTPase
MLVDLAGLDDVDTSMMNMMMQASARAALERAELRLHCVPIDADEPIHARPDDIVIRTKSDRRPRFVGELSVSAHTGEGLPELRRAIAQRLSTRAVSLAAGILALQPRHEAAMRSALSNLDAAIELVEPLQSTRSLPNPELVASSMRAALDDLASLAGEMTPDDILGRIFATFCVGK